MRVTAGFTALIVLLAPVSGAAAQAAPGTVYRLDIHGTIENGLAPYVARGIREAGAAGASAVILDLDTPGGRIDAAERIVDAVRGSKVPVYAFVNPRAYSAGAMVAIATRGIYMRSGAVLGAATPVDGQGARLPEKYVSAMRGEFRALAEARGLDPHIAEAMVDESLGVPGLADPGRLVTLSTSEALRVKFASGQAESAPELLTMVGLGGATIHAIDPNWAEVLVRFLTNPLVAPVLLSIGVLALIAEIKAGAHGLGLLLGFTCLGLFFGSSLLVGLAGLEEVILLGLGVIAVGVEVFLLPGFGVAGILGALLVGAAIVLSLLGSYPTSGDVLRALAVLGASVVVTLSVAFAWLRHLPYSGRFAGLIHQSAAQSGEGFVAALPRGELIGKTGVAVTDLRPAGVATVAGERIDVVTEGEYVSSGAPVVVVRAEGYRHVVRQSQT
jgi:membrane-bound serine protease (ClpP class)